MPDQRSAARVDAIRASLNANFVPQTRVNATPDRISNATSAEITVARADDATTLRIIERGKRGGWNELSAHLNANATHKLANLLIGVSGPDALWLLAELNRATARLDATRDLHEAMNLDGEQLLCIRCRDVMEHPIHYPCDTAQAVAGLPYIDIAADAPPGDPVATVRWLDIVGWLDREPDEGRWIVGDTVLPTRMQEVARELAEDVQLNNQQPASEEEHRA